MSYNVSEQISGYLRFSYSQAWNRVQHFQGQLDGREDNFDQIPTQKEKGGWIKLHQNLKFAYFNEHVLELILKLR